MENPIRDYVTSVELMIATGLDRHTIDHILSYLTKFEKLMSLRPDTWIRKTRCMSADVKRTLMATIISNDSSSCMQRCMRIFGVFEGLLTFEFITSTCLEYNSMKCLRYALDTARYACDIDYHMERVINESIIHGLYDCFVSTLDKLSKLDISVVMSVQKRVLARCIKNTHLSVDCFAHLLANPAYDQNHLTFCNKWLVALVIRMLHYKRYDFLHYVLRNMCNTFTSENYDTVVDYIALQVCLSDKKCRHPLWFMRYIMNGCSRYKQDVIESMIEFLTV